MIETITACLPFVFHLAAQQFAGRLDPDFTSFTSDDAVNSVSGAFTDGGEIRSGAESRLIRYLFTHQLGY
jgi:hypothetical protein